MTYTIIFLTLIVTIAALRNRSLFNRLALIPYRVNHNREWWRIITHGFVHADYIHLAVNMVVLLSFGQFIEQFFDAYTQIGLISNGDAWYLLLYFGGMICASIYDLVRYRNNPAYASIGASGAVAAVVFTSIFFNPWGKLYLLSIIPIQGSFSDCCISVTPPTWGDAKVNESTISPICSELCTGFCFRC